MKRRGRLFGTWRPDAPGDIKVEKNRGNFEKNDVHRFHFLWLWSCKILSNESNNHISFQCCSVQLVKLLVAGTQQMG